MGVVFQRWRRVAADETTPTVSSFGAVPVASLADGHGAIALRDDESVWIGFDAADGHVCVARVLALGTELVDAVTGEAPTEGLDPRAQNYIVLPPQYALTGRTVSPRCARQFVRGAEGPHHEAITELHVTVYRSIAEPTVRDDERTYARGRGATRPGRADVPTCGVPGHVPQVIQEDAGVHTWDTTRAWQARIEVLAGDEYRRRTGQAPLPPAAPDASYGGWRLP
ncbi:MAG TPA: hypothetical protein VMF13_13090 [Luteitalea sp.]|nr:hypothetical protein [Luteitalea sp.]